MTEAEAEYREKRSIFIAKAFNITSVKEAENKVEEIKKFYHTARHHPFAWIIDSQGQISSRSSDDGEPARSSGPPILAKMEGEKLINALIIVIRYYGGIKLGTGNLARAYGNTAEMAIKIADRVPYIKKSRLAIKCPYPLMGPVIDAIVKSNGEIISTDSSAPCLSSCDNSSSMALIIVDTPLKNESVIREKLSRDTRILIEKI